MARRSIIATFIAYVSVFAFFSVLLLGGLLLYSLNHEYMQRAEQARENFMQRKRDQLRTEVSRSLDYINFVRARSDIVLRQTLKSRVDQAHTLAQQLLETFKDEIGEKELRRLIIEALRPMRFDDGRCYYFATGTDGTVLLYPENPSYEGHNVLIDKFPFRGKIIKKMIDLARKDGEGFIEYAWTMPGKAGEQHDKISYIKYFEPFDMFIGSGEYLEHIQEQTQQKVIEHLQTIHFGDDGYIFASTWEGISLIGPAKGKNVWDATDVNGVKVVQKLIDASKKPEGDFLTYVMPPVDSKYSQQKRLSFARGVPDWQWYVGAGVSLDALNEVISQNTKEMTADMEAKTWRIAGVLLLLLIFNAGMAILAQRNLSRSFNSFYSFFTEGVKGYGKVDRNKLAFSEFDTMAILANQMIERRMQVEKELEDLNRHLEETVEERTETLIRQTRELEIANQKLRDLDEMKSNFLNTVSHDLRTPMTSLLGFSKLIQRDFTRRFVPVAEEDATLSGYSLRIIKNFDIINSEGERLLRLINDFLDLSKIEQGRLEWNDHPVNMERLVQQTMYSVDGQFAAKPDVSVETIIDGHIPKLVADQDRLQQVLVNLLVNAAKFTETGKVELKVAAAGNERAPMVRFSISDTGIGIPEEEQQRIFERFYQSKDDHSPTSMGVEYQGSGLGLSICKLIVEHYGGRIWVNSSLGHGSTFHVELPAEKNSPSEE